MTTVRQPGQAVGVHQALEHQISVEQLLLANPQSTVGFVALQQRQVGTRVVANARHQLNVVRQFDQVVVGPGSKGRALDQRVFLGRQDNDRDVLGGRVIAVFAHQGQAIEPRHDQVLQDHRRLDSHGLFHSLMRVGAKVEINILFMRQTPSHCLTDHCLIVD
ncbi:hypothetical protein D3C81_299400 [compost metagenome]